MFAAAPSRSSCRISKLAIAKQARWNSQLALTAAASNNPAIKHSADVPVRGIGAGAKFIHLWRLRSNASFVIQLTCCCDTSTCQLDLPAALLLTPDCRTTAAPCSRRKPRWTRRPLVSDESDCNASDGRRIQHPCFTFTALVSLS